MKKMRIVSIFLILNFLIFACGGSDEAGNESTSTGTFFERVEDNSVTYSVDDFTDIGYKKAKTVKQDKLMDGMTNAYWGFWKVPYKDWSGKDMIDYELRFFSSHADAVSMGEKSSDLRTG